MKKYFCTGDVHSFFDEWMLALESKGFDVNNPDHIIIVCGDLFDRGDKSRECYNFMTKMLDLNRAIYVRGNHEDLLLDCVASLKRHMHIGGHHISNGTIKTIAQMMNCSEYDVLCHVYTEADLETAINELLSLVDRTVDYAEIGNFVFVHGWVPTTYEEDRTTIVHENWREGNWKEARWENGMEMAHFGILVPDKTVVCGHWHTSWGHSRYHKDGDEWDPTTANFDPYFDEGIIALDACTVYTHKINVIVIEE